MKKYLAILLVCITIFFSGCCQINYGINISKDNSIQEAFEVKLDQTFFDDNEIQPDILFDEIDKQMNKWLSDKIANREIEGFSFEVEKDSPNFSISLILSYANQTVYQSFWNIKETPSSKKETKFRFLYDVLIISKNSTIFKDIEQSSFANYFKNWCKEHYGNLNFKEGNFKFGYVYGMPKETNYMSNADSVVLAEDTVFHIWQFNLANSDKEVCFFIPIMQGRNVACCFITILVFTLLFAVFLYFKLKE